MIYKVNDAIFGDNCETEARNVFLKNHLFTKDELIMSLEYSLDYIKTDGGITDNSRMKKLELYERFLSAVKNCKLPDLPSDDWRCYEYKFIGDGIVLELQTIDEIEFHEDELDCISISDYKELLSVSCAYVSIQDFALIQGVKEETVIRWINTGKLKNAKLGEDNWLIPSVEDKPRRGQMFIDYLIEPGLRLDEFPFVRFCESVCIRQAGDDKTKYRCTFDSYLDDFHEEMILSKVDVERLEFLLISSGKAKLNGYAQYMPCIK